ncbi:hypothetical protein AB0G02_39900 [Actinosynnema sp. NPDC023658]|uniref:hypothetical protein n=1 Tax=Actinosynnema sp. NPDC023658 TaxID=3155465 RepID=UPI0033DEC03E
MLIVCAAVAGIGVEVFPVSFNTAVQEQVLTERLSRVSSYDLLFGLAFMPLGYLVAGPVSQWRHRRTGPERASGSLIRRTADPTTTTTTAAGPGVLLTGHRASGWTGACLDHRTGDR